MLLISSSSRLKRYFFFGMAGLFMAFSSGRLISIDEGSRLALAHRLWAHGSVFVPDLHWPCVTTPWGKTTFYGIGQSLLFIPFDMFGTALMHLAPNDAVHAQWQWLPLVFLYAPIFGALWWLSVVVLLEELGLSLRESLIGSSLFFLSTLAFSHCAQTLNEEIPVGILVTQGLIQVLRWRRDSGARPAILAGLFFSLGGLVRMNAVFAFLPAVGVVADLLYRRVLSVRLLSRNLGLAVLGAMPALILHLIFAYWRFGSPFSTGYDLIRNDYPMSPINWSWAFQLLFGLSKGGAFILSPPLLLALGGMFLARRERPFLWTATAGALFISAVFHSRLLDPSGGPNWGCRYQVHLLGFFAYPAILCAKRLFSHATGKALVGTVLALGLGFQLIGFYLPHDFEYLQDESVYQAWAIPLFDGGWKRGHLPRRLGNIVHAGGMSRELASWPGTPGAGYQLQTMWSRYQPNIWGFSFSRRISTGWLSWSCFLGWIWLVVGSIALLGRGAQLLRNTKSELSPS